MKIEINISRRVLYTFLSVIILGLVAVGVYAYGTSSPSVVGHSIGEIDGLGDLATKNSVNWSEVTNKPAESVVVVNSNMGEDIYQAWNTDGGAWVSHAPHADSCNGDNTNAYTCLPSEDRSCLDSAETGSPAHHRRITCIRVGVWSS